MPIRFLPPLPPQDGWAAHRKEVRACTGAACFAALTSHFGSESPKALEKLVDDRLPYVTQAGDQSLSNKYRKWLAGTSLPSLDSVLHVLARSNGAVDLYSWRYLPLWELLQPAPPPLATLHRFMEQAAPPVRKILFFDENPDRYGRFVHEIPDADTTLALRNLYSLDAFLALLCLARKGEILDYDPYQSLPSLYAFDIFPRVLLAQKPLLFRWERLFECIARIFWRRHYSGGVTLNFDISTIRSRLETQLEGSVVKKNP